ncbi:hypothetical protein [Aquamicrobium sp. LC103]|uniref:hypothetical protein n=1 Tax=Aquamicrobium sp. LC103 TaxID=1120658 RepID=UPI00069A662D|nr:hypothetical protein [Aquamicrobium sp. LC103]TKT81180.1 glycosyl transferase [Aquamicrobium sp. LC103]
MLSALSFLSAFVGGLAALHAALRLLSGFGAAAPDARSNHARPTPQLGGIALVPVWLAVVLAASALAGSIPVFSDPFFIVAVLVLFLTGIMDDRNSLGPVGKLVAQFLACGLATVALVGVLEEWPVPMLLLAPATLLALVAVVNLTNFIDGLDLMAVSTVGVPSLVFVALAAAIPALAGFGPAAAACAGAFAAFATINRPPARAFLGDSGSLPFGLILGTLAVVLAIRCGPFAAALLPAYILLDGFYTFFKRARNGESLMTAHSSHVYQRAYRGGRSALEVTGTVAGFGMVAGLVCLAIAQIAWPFQLLAVMAIVALWCFAAKWLTGMGKAP